MDQNKPVRSRSPTSAAKRFSSTMSAELHSRGSSSPASLKLQNNHSASYHPSKSTCSQSDYPVTGGSLHVGSSPSSLPMDQLSSSGGARPKTQASEATQRGLSIEGKPSVKEDVEGNPGKISTLAFEILVDVQFTLSASVSNIPQKHTERIPVDYVRYIRWQLITTCLLLRGKAMKILESHNIGITFWRDRVSLTIRDNAVLKTNKVTQIILDVVDKLDKDTAVLPPLELPEDQIVYLKNKLNNSISFKIINLYFEVMDKNVCIACYGEDAKHEVLDIVSQFKNTPSLDRPQTVSIYYTLPVYMKKVLLYFKVFEKCQSQCQDVRWTTVNQNAQFIITLTGSKESVEKAQYLISSYIDKLANSKCKIFFSINALSAIDTLSLEDVIQQHLDNKGFMCAVVQCGREIYLYSDKPIEVSWKAASEAAKAICSKSVLLTGSWRDKYDDLKKSVESCVTGPYLLQSSAGAKMNILGYVSVVEKAAKVIESIMAGEISLKQSTQKGLTSSSLVSEKNTGSHSFVNQQKNQYIKNCESYKSKAETKSLEHDRGHSYAVMSCQGDDRVWSFPEDSVLFLTQDAKEYCAKVVVRLSMQVSDEAHFSCCGKSADGVCAELRLPRWKGGNQNEMEEFERRIKKTLVKVNEEEANSVMLMVVEMLGWNKVLFLQSLIGPLVQHLVRRKNQPKKIILCVPNEDIFLEAVKELQCYVGESYKGEASASCGQLRVCVVEGMIHETKADVLVNTTAANLDLNHGQVSSAILRAAGMEIQYECWNKFPENLRLGEIAITMGYKLKCKNVFHGTLPKFNHKNEVESIQNLRTLVETCLCKADRNRFESIAFPAIGAGNLKYPVAMVASEMFGAVERFKRDHTQLSLRDVFFVIHPKDTNSLMEFRKIEQDLVKPIQYTRSGSPDYGQQAKIQPTRAEGFDDGKQAKVQPTRAEGLNNGKQAKVQPTRAEGLDDGQQAKIQPTRAEGMDNGKQSKIQPTRAEGFDDGKQSKIQSTRAEGMDDGKQAKIQSTRAEGFDDGKQAKIQSTRAEGFDDGKHSKIQSTRAEGFDNGKQAKIQSTRAEGFDDGKQAKIQSVRAEGLDDGKHSKIQSTRAEGMDGGKHSKIQSVRAEGLDDGKQAKIQSTRAEGFDDGKQAKEQSTRAEGLNDGKQAKIQSTRAEGMNDGKQTEVQPTRQVHELTVGTKIFPNILTQEYAALRHFFDRELQLCSAEAGVMMGFRDNVISIEGEKGAVKQAYTEIGTCLKYIKDMRQRCIPLQQTENDVKQTVKQYKKKYPQVFCFFDQVRTVLVFMSENKDDLEKVSHMLHKELCGAGKEANGQAKMKMDSQKNRENKNTASVQGNISSSLKSQAQILDKNNGDSNDMALIQRQQHEAKTDERNATGGNSPSTGTAGCLKDNHVETKSHIHTANIVTKTRGATSDADEVSDQIAGRKPMLASGTAKVIPSFIEDKDSLRCTFTKGFVVKIFTASILEMSGMDTIVCSEDQSGKAAGMIAKALLKQGGVEYQREKAAAFKVPPPPGEIVTTGGGKSNFKTVIHALVPLRRDDTNIKSLYLKIFQEAIAAKSKTLAMSLLATGAGGQQAMLAGQILYNSCMEFCQNNPDGRLKVSVVNIDNFKTKDIVGVFKEFINQHSIDLPPMTSPSSWKQTGQPSTHPLTPPTSQKTKETEVVDREAGESSDDTDVAEVCVICMDEMDNAKSLRCGHRFCTECIDQYFKVKQMCPTCGEVCGVILGDQPDGMLQVQKSATPLAGHPGCGCIILCYFFPDGKQLVHHPSPGMEYKGFRRVAYLPDNNEGRKVAAMLIVAFQRRLVFTIGRSRTTGKDGVITWNDIHHKTDPRPNTQFGYPDASYLSRVKEELAAKGVTEKDLEQPFLVELSKPTFKQDYRS